MFSKEQIFVVTGASSGIGRAAALELNARGATVVAVARRADRLEEAKALAKNPESFHCEVKDLAEDIENLPKYVKSLKDKYGRLRGLAYCAGIDEIAPLQALDLAGMRRLFDINYFAPIFMAKGFADRRVNSGKGSAMVFISSIAGEKPDKGMASYSGSKAALTASAKCAAKELAALGVRVNAISPTIILTDMSKRLPNLSAQEEKYPFGFGSPEDVAHLAAFLLSDKAKWISGQNYIADCASL